MSEQVPPFVLPDGVTLIKDVTYGTGGGRELKCDLFLPAGGGGNGIGIIFIHGGGWRAGTRTQFYRQAARLSERGCVGVCVEYRLSGEAKFPAAVEDVKCAVRWLRANAQDYDISPDRIAAVGGSAGGHLAAMLGTTDASAGLEGKGGYPEYPSRVNAMVAFNGIFDLARQNLPSGTSEAVSAFLGGLPEEIPEVYKLASPLHHADESSAPSLLFHGTGDTVVPFEQSELFEERLKELGVPVELYAEEGAEHGFFNSSPYFEPTLEHMEHFILDTLS